MFRRVCRRVLMCFNEVIDEEGWACAKSRAAAYRAYANEPGMDGPCFQAIKPTNASIKSIYSAFN
jgi:hypothetical protein